MAQWTAWSDQILSTGGIHDPDHPRTLRSEHVLERLFDLFVQRGLPDYIRPDSRAEFTETFVRDWLGKIGVKTLCIQPGSAWENGYADSFNGRLRDEPLNGELFYTLREVQILIARWRQNYNAFRPHSSLGYKPPAPEAVEVGPPTGRMFTSAAELALT
jgi:transposase InsO family protein